MGYALTSKGQVTIPKHIREKLGVGPGDSVTFAANDRGEVILSAMLSNQEHWNNAVREAQTNFQMDMSTDELLEMTRGTDRYGRDIERAE